MVKDWSRLLQISLSYTRDLQDPDMRPHFNCTAAMLPHTCNHGLLLMQCLVAADGNPRLTWQLLAPLTYQGQYRHKAMTKATHWLAIDSCYTSSRPKPIDADQGRRRWKIHMIHGCVPMQCSILKLIPKSSTNEKLGIGILSCASLSITSGALPTLLRLIAWPNLLQVLLAGVD